FLRCPGRPRAARIARRPIPNPTSPSERSSATMADRLLELLTKHSFAKKKVVLTSGRESDFFIDVKQTALLAEGHALIGEAMLRALADLPERPAAVAGVELGGI